MAASTARSRSGWRSRLAHARRSRPGCPRARRAAASTSSAPTSMSTSTSWPASTFLARSRRHVPNRSIHPVTVYSYRPSSGTGNSPLHASSTSGSMDASVQPVVPSRRNWTTQANMSCPSANTSASTSTDSPAARLTGNRPQSTSGRTRSITTRRLPSPAFTERPFGGSAFNHYLAPRCARIKDPSGPAGWGHAQVGEAEDPRPLRDPPLVIPPGRSLEDGERLRRVEIVVERTPERLPGRFDLVGPADLPIHTAGGLGLELFV